MADNGKWFKLWVSCLIDSDLSNLDIADFGRWAKFGAYLKAHGEEGNLVIKKPARELLFMFQVSNYEEVLLCIKRFPNCTIKECVSECQNETIATVTWENWHKYQGDMSTERVRKFRQVKRSKKRGEKKRGEDMPLSPHKAFIDFAFSTFQEKYGEKLHIVGGKDGELVGQLLETYDLERLKGYWSKFLIIADNDDFIKKAGISIGIFKSSINKIITSKFIQTKRGVVI